MALLATGIMLKGLQLQPAQDPSSAGVRKVVYLSVPSVSSGPSAAKMPLASRPSGSPPRQEKSDAEAPERRGRSGRPPAASMPPGLSGEGVVEAAPMAAAPVQAASQAAQPPVQLDLGPSVIGQAVAQSRSGLRRMAGASGAYAGDSESGPAQRLAQETERAGKPDCIRAGGSLLAPLTLLYELALDKCRNR